MQAPEISRQQFNAMKEFRTCTVEAQAATEELREEMEDVISNLKCRRQLFNELNGLIEKLQEVVGKSKKNLSSVIKSVKVQVEEKIAIQKTIMSGKIKLIDMKNEIDEARAKLTDNQVDKSNTHGSNEKEDFFSRLLDKIVEETDYLVCNLVVFMSKDGNGITLLTNLDNEMKKIMDYLEHIQKLTERVVS